MEKKKNVPRLRFPGFADEWEQRKLGEMQKDNFLMLKRGNIIPKQKGRYPVYSSSATGDGLFCTTDSFMFDDEKVTWSIDGGGRVFYRPKHKFSVTNVCGYVDILTNTLDCKYLALAMEKAWSQTTFDYVTKAHPSVISELYTISVPCIEEQIYIGSFFKRLDNLITLHQGKLDTIKQYKQGMIQKMFPKEGEKVPEIRFPGFTTNWDSVCLGDLYRERNERGDDTLPILSVSIHTGVSGGELDTEELGKNVRRSEDKSLYKRVYSGDLVFNMMRAWQGAIGVVKNEGMVSPAYISAVPNERVYPPFMDYLLRRNEVINQINNLSYGVTDFRKRLYWDSFVQVGVCLPSLEEQMMITALFQEMDSYLSVNQKKVNQMLQYKQGLLQQMFV